MVNVTEFIVGEVLVQYCPLVQTAGSFSVLANGWLYDRGSTMPVVKKSRFLENGLINVAKVFEHDEKL